MADAPVWETWSTGAEVGGVPGANRPGKDKGLCTSLVVQSPRFSDPSQLVIAGRGLLPPNG